MNYCSGHFRVLWLVFCLVVLGIIDGEISSLDDLISCCVAFGLAYGLCFCLVELLINIAQRSSRGRNVHGYKKVSGQRDGGDQADYYDTRGKHDDKLSEEEADVWHVVEVVEIGGTSPSSAFTVTAGAMSRRGYYPESLRKFNQDRYCVIANLAGYEDPSMAPGSPMRTTVPSVSWDEAAGDFVQTEQCSVPMFCVFDGHGPSGNLCASFACTHLPLHLKQTLEENGIDCSEGGGDEWTARQRRSTKDPDKRVRFLRAYEEAFLRCNQQLHDSDVNDNRSGTTAISVMLWAHTLQVANVGDSRAIVCTVVSELEEEDPCRRVEGQRRLKVKARALSSDHTPFRKDERERVKSFGARVMTVNQVLK
jgi:serine/threonine protein phosphatase PrpC